ncbi:MAG: hypothetical protein V4549_20055 [Bacteroidota bacterium]
MKKENLILMLVGKSANAFGELIGLTEEAKLNVALSIIQDTIKKTFDINSNLLTPNTIYDILVKDQLDCDQIHLLAHLLWTKAEILSKLDRQITSLTNYENTLLLLQWRLQQSFEKNQLEKQSKITELEAIIVTLKPKSIMKN